MKRVAFLVLAIVSLAFTSCFSFGNGTISSSGVGGMIASGGVASILTANNGTWESQTDSNVIVQFLPNIVGRETGQNWYEGVVSTGGKTSKFVWLASSYTDQSGMRKSELFVKDDVGASKDLFRYVLSQNMYTITIIFTEDGSTSGVRTLPVPNGMYSQTK